MCAPDVLEKIIRQIVKLYHNTYGNDLISVYLYGSYARGDYDSESDIDFVAIVDGERYLLQKKLDTILDVTCDLSLNNDILISPKVIPYAEFKNFNTKLPYYMNIVKEGKRVG